MPLYTKPVWSYAIFQIPAFLTILFLTLAVLTYSQAWFLPEVAVQIALDLSSSTYESTKVFRGSGTIMQAEIDAVKEYAARNASLPTPNLLSLSGFADRVVPITQNFSKHPREIEAAIEGVIQPSIAPQLGGSTNLNEALDNGLGLLKTQAGKCKEILVITDGQANIEPAKIDQASQNKVRLNFLIVGQPVPPNLATAAVKTSGVAITASSVNISALVSGRLFNRFNSNLPRIKLFLGAAWISLMWMVILPIDRWLQNQIKLRFDRSSLIALSNAIFWTIIVLFWAVSLNLFQGC
jgi:Ca-activated chloride channel homolog